MEQLVLVLIKPVRLHQSIGAADAHFDMLGDAPPLDRRLQWPTRRKGRRELSDPTHVWPLP
jgi:hypothetical protein